MAKQKTAVCLEQTSTIPSLKKQGAFDIKFSHDSKITSPMEAISFPYRAINEEESCKLMNILEVKSNSKMQDMVTVKCKLTGFSVRESVKQNLDKVSVTAIDGSADITLVLWNKLIDEATENCFYRVTNVRVKSFNQEVYLSTTLDTELEEIDEFQTVEVELPKDVWTDIDTIEIISTSHCFSCKSAIIVSEPQGMTVKCSHCKKRMLTTKIQKVTQIKVSVENKEFTIAKNMLEHVFPLWNEKTFSDLEDDMLLHCEVNIKGNNVVGLRKKKI
ncbi:uncharacterized protein LOC132758602 [Ruditapes philippinarum]|uniref:uncharacterized protein LOC132758602 n=1 Tax=Ruditapes philippinarum TaxID=129788 RepID=UPI00295A90C3|nr:uncharacterized protein LOC132758602 [Ruditapes philippinarum]